jgi:hypothetical protein
MMEDPRPSKCLIDSISKLIKAVEDYQPRKAVNLLMRQCVSVTYPQVCKTRK